MSLKDKLVNTIASHSRLVTFGIGLAVTLAIGTIIGMLGDPSHSAAAVSQSNTGGSSQGPGH